MTATTFKVGGRYPMTMKDAMTVMKHGWPIVRGVPDLSRGRRLLATPCKWEFWTTDGRQVEFDLQGGSLIVSQSKGPDPDRPEPLK